MVWARCLTRTLGRSLRPAALSVSCRSFHVPASSYVPLPDNLKHGEIIRYPHRGRAHILAADEHPPVQHFRIAVVGASGSIGRQTAVSLVSRRKQFAGLGPMTVQFVGQRGDHSLATLMGLCSELRDAYEDFCPHLEVTVDIEAVQANIIIYEAGGGLSKQFPTHTDLARANADMFGKDAIGLFAKNQHSTILIVSNPSEFGVDTFVQAGFRPQQVLGVGPFLESLRFRREIASELGVPRQHVSGLVLGAHGLAMVPCWSTVHMSPIVGGPEKVELLEQLKSEGLARMPKDVQAVRDLAYTVRDLAVADQTLAASALVNKQPADIRATVRRYLSFFSGPFYPRLGVAEAVTEIVSSLLSGKDTIAAGTVHCSNGQFLGITGHAIGAPVIVSGHGFELAPVDLLPIEKESVLASAEEIKSLSNTAVATRLFKLIKRKAAQSV